MKGINLTRLKDESRYKMLGNYGSLVNGVLFIKLSNVLISDVLSYISTVEDWMINLIVFLVQILLNCLLIGYYKICFNIIDDKEVAFADLFTAFKSDTNKAIIISTILSFFEMLPTFAVSCFNIVYANRLDTVDLVLVNVAVYAVGLVVLLFFYTYFVLSIPIFLSHQELTAVETIKESVSIVNQNFFDFFKLIFSFAGYYILGFVTFQISELFTAPYMYMTQIYFYKETKGENNGYYFEA